MKDHTKGGKVQAWTLYMQKHITLCLSSVEENRFPFFSAFPNANCHLGMMAVPGQMPGLVQPNFLIQRASVLSNELMKSTESFQYEEAHLCLMVWNQ